MKGWRKTKRVVKGCVKGEKGRREGGGEGSAFAQRTHAKPMHMLVPRTVRICACIACRALLCMFLSRRSLGFDPAPASAPRFPDGRRILIGLCAVMQPRHSAAWAQRLALRALRC